MDSSPVLITKGLTKKFGEFTAVNNVDFEMQGKETVGIIGPNGAGKTTFINLITGYYLPSNGAVFTQGNNITGFSPAKRVALGIARTFQLVHVFDNLSVSDNVALSYFRKKEDKSLSLHMFIWSLKRSSINKRVQEILAMVKLDHLRDETVENLPLGAKKMLEIAMIFVSDPKIVILDEPFSGLSDHEIDEIVGALKKYTHNKTTLIVEHKISKLTEFVDRLAVMHEGRMIFCGGCEETLNDPNVRRCYWKIT